MNKTKRFFCLIAVVAMLATMPLASADGLLPWTGETVVYQGLGNYLGVDDNEDTMILQEWRSQLGNVRIEWALPSGDDYGTLLTLAFNSGDMPDIMWVAGVANKVAAYADYGYFLNLAEYAEYMPNWTAIQNEMPAIVSINGKNGEIWAVGDIEPYDFAHEGFFVNLTGLNELGIEMPETWDEYIDAMKAYKQLHPDSTPYIAYWSSVIDSVMYSLNGYKDFFYDNEAGKWDHPMLNEEASHYKQIISVMAELYANELIDPDYATMSLDQKNQVLLNGDWLLAYITGSCVENYALKYGECDYEYALCAAPKADADALSYNKVNFRSDVPPAYGYLVSADVEHPELMASLLDKIISAEASALYNWGIEGVTYTIDDNGQFAFIDGYDNVDKMREAGIRQFSDVRMVMRKDRMAEFVGMSERERQLYIDLNLMYGDGTLTAYIPARETPSMSTEAKEENAAIMMPIKTYIDENVAMFIDGSRPLSEWDAFVAVAIAMGDIERVLENYEAGIQFEAAAERKYLINK